MSHRTCRVLTHSGFFRALSVTAAVFRGSPSLFGVVAGACIAVSLLRSGAAGVLLRWVNYLLKVEFMSTTKSRIFVDCYRW